MQTVAQHPREIAQKSGSLFAAIMLTADIERAGFRVTDLDMHDPSRVVITVRAAGKKSKSSGRNA